MEAILTGFAANVLASVIGKVGTFLLTKTDPREIDAADELKKLQGELVNAQILIDNLRTAETWQHKTSDILRDIYDIEDLVDDLMVDNSNSSVLQKIKPFKGKSKSARKKIHEVRQRLEAITSELKLVNKTQQQEQQRQCGAIRISGLDPDKLLGRKEEKEEIIRLLLEDTISSVNIVGIGGLGKTTLAWDVQSDPRIKKKFHHNIRWFSMSAEFGVTAVVESILQESLQNGYTFLPNQIRGLFQKMHAEKSILIVLDGLLDVTSAEWKSFSSLVLPASAGCKVLVTTQNPQIASKTGAARYHLPLMRDEDCKALVIESALRFKPLPSRQHEFLKSNAGKIAQMSKGLPLAASVLGHSLSSNRDEPDWMALSDKNIYHTREFKEEIFPVLKLNTANMRSHLSRCLAHCSLFPRNYHFNRESLAQLWMAEGFFLPEETKSLLEIGIGHFNDLYGRSFFQPSQLGEHEISRQSSYKMHEFIHRFAETVASGICFRFENINDFSSNCWHKKARHLSFVCTESCVQLDFKKIEKCKGLRTFLLPSGREMSVGQIPRSFFGELGRLRVLDLSCTDVKKIPGLGISKFLRYLDLSKSLIELLPDSISKLVGLQVLKLKGCAKLLRLPKDLYTLTSLVHLEVDMQHLRIKPTSIGRLSQLQTLPTFFVGEEEGKRIRELKDLNSLRGTLNLVNLDKIEGKAEAMEANLRGKQSLRRLELEWSGHFTDEAKAKDVFEGLEPHHYVEELKVTHYVGSSFPSWLTRQSCTLVRIEVKYCSLDDVLPALGQLPYLEILHLEGMHFVTQMRCPVCGDGSGGAFPSLKSLKIKDMEYLTSWHRLPVNCMLKLNDLTIMDCPRLSSMQSLNHISSLQTLEINRCPVLQALPQLPPSVQSLIIIESDMVKQRCQPQGPEWHMIRSISRVEIDDSRIDFVVDPPRFRQKLFSNLCFSCLVLAFAFLSKLFWFYYSAQKH